MDTESDRSRYRQVRITISEVPPDRVSVRILVKPLRASWRFQDSVWHHSWRTGTASTHWLDLVATTLERVLSEDLTRD